MNYFKEKLRKLEYNWLSGNILASPKFSTNFIFPKMVFWGLLDATKFVKRGEEDYFVLTPTQAAALLIQWKLKTDLLENLKN